MPAVKPATITANELPDVCTVAELAAFERVDVRTLRAELKQGRVPGAYRRGRSWRIVTQTYFAMLAATNAAMEGEAQ